jgi:hypothetical protein
MKEDLSRVLIVLIYSQDKLKSTLLTWLILHRTTRASNSERRIIHFEISFIPTINWSVLSTSINHFLLDTEMIFNNLIWEREFIND